jgi:deaminated glutathione amidase
MTVVRITLAQIDSASDIERNVGLIQRAVETANIDGSSLVVFPEYAMYEKKAVDATFAAVAEPVDGEFCTALSTLAGIHGVTIIAGMVEANPAEPLRPFNTLVVFGSDGGFVGRHRKIHLYHDAGFQESAWISPANEPRGVVLDAAGVRLGLMTCNDLRYPELGVELASDGAKLVVVCASWVPGPNKVEQWRVLVRARAIENRYTVVAVSQPSPISIGNSLVSLPSGQVLRELGGEPAVVTVNVDITS